MTHYDDEALFQYAEGTSPIAGEVASHVADCAACQRELGAHRQIVDALRENDVWERDATPVSVPRRFVVDVAAFAERARQEELAAVNLCDEILTGPSAWWGQRLRNTENVQTAGMVKELLARMRCTLESSPAKALVITSLAIELANGLDVVSYPCDYVVKLRAQACRDHAYVLKFLGRYPEALEMADQAKLLFDQVPLPEFDLARLALVRATILNEIDRAREAVALAREAAETFRRFGDRTRYLDARLTEGAMLTGCKAYEESLVIWKELLHDPDLESVSRIRVMHNMGLAYTNTSQPSLAAEYLQQAMAEFELLGMETERTRSRFILAQTLMNSGKVRESIPLLRKTWREFDQLDMVASAGLAALHLAEALLIIEDAIEVPAICRDIVARFSLAGMTSRAMTALSFLREAVAIGEVSPALVRHVHAFLRKLPDERPRLHAPSPLGSLGE